ncbi:MAG TPA: Hsp20/alpha crystallin family protein [Deltaproteobacteria bacterium]|nr:Hsp20/alpha crystallin family protein [Deltaproteobacteria bacterium]
MSTLERWNPFKFLRRSKESQSEEPDATTALETRAAATPATPVTAIDPRDPFTSMVRVMDAMMRDPFFRDPFANFGQVDRWFGDFSPSRFGVSVDVVDEGEALRVDFELPGMSKDDVTLSIENGTLVLKGHKQQLSESDEDGVYRSERYFGSVQRSVPLPRDLDLEAAEASFKDGVLGVRFPKRPSPAEGGRTIAVR